MIEDNAHDKRHYLLPMVAIVLLFIGFLAWPKLLISAGYYFVSSGDGIDYIKAYTTSIQTLKDAAGTADLIEGPVSGDEILLHDGHLSISFDHDGRKDFIQAAIGLGTVSLLPQDQRKDGLVIGLGSGISSGFIADYFDHLDVYETKQSVFDLAKNHFAKRNRHVTNRENVAIHLQDGLLGLANTHKKYDAIWVNIPSPAMRGAGNIFSADAASLIKQRLKPGGLAMFWLSTEMSADALQVVYNSMEKELGSCRYFVAYESFIQGICQPDAHRSFLTQGAFHVDYQSAWTNNQAFSDWFIHLEIMPIQKRFTNHSINRFDTPWFDSRDTYHWQNKYIAMQDFFTPKQPDKASSSLATLSIPFLFRRETP